MEYYQSLKDEEMMKSNSEINRIMSSSLMSEVQRTERVKRLALKTLSSRIKINEHQQELTESIELKKIKAEEKLIAAEKRYLESKELLALKRI